MNQEEKRIKIAEALGFVKIYQAPTGPRGEVPISSSQFLDCALPDYFNDLNACHAMEEMLTSWKQKQRFMRFRVRSIQTCYFSADWEEAWKLSHATAAQRAEAFGRTLNLWTS